MRIAFVFGSNGPQDLGPLQYARRDADRIADRLASPAAGFTVLRPPSEADAWDVRRSLVEAAERCAPEDTFVCYFSGHGLLERGSLLLMWDHTDRDKPIGTGVPMSSILEATKTCLAGRKLVVLDCCHAGQVVNMAGFKGSPEPRIEDTDVQPEGYLVLMASDRLERAREIDELGGGFLTAKLCAALGDEFDEADIDGDGRLSMHDLNTWLGQETNRHNRRNPQFRVPRPFLFGEQKGEFFLTAGDSDWEPITLQWPNDTTMIVLPARVVPPEWPVASQESVFGGRAKGRQVSADLFTGDEHAICIASHLVTNEQYRRYLSRSREGPPVGEVFVDGRWHGGFSPWDDSRYNDPHKLVVCLSVKRAERYCEWLKPTGFFVRVHLPFRCEWELAAYGRLGPPDIPAARLSRASAVHHRADAPAVVGSPKRTDPWGIEDLVGNVWEWTGEFRPGERAASVIARPEVVERAGLAGGGFLDDLERIGAFVDAARLRRGEETCHCDIGFRLAAELPIRALPAEHQAALRGCRQVRLPPWRLAGGRVSVMPPPLSPHD